MLLRFFIIILISVAIVWAMDYANHLVSDADIIIPEQIRYQEGDSAVWKNPNFDDSGWSSHLPDDSGVGWLRATFHVIDHPAFRGKQKEVIITFLGSYELFWEGVFVGENGKVSAVEEEEVRGYLDYEIIIPDSLVSDGMQVLALRYSDHINLHRNQITSIRVEPYHEYFKRSIVQSMLIYLLAGIFLITAIYYFFLYFNSFHRLNYLLFAWLCLLSFILIVFVYSRIYYPYLYSYYDNRQLIINIFSGSVVLLLPGFFGYHFNHPHKKLIFLGSVLLLMILRGIPIISGLFSTLSVVTIVIAILIALYLAIWANLKKVKGSAAALTGLLAFVGSSMNFNLSVYVGFGILVIAMLLSLSLTIGADRKEQIAYMLRSSRLESQLLKKNIHPHFLMNTLTNIISLIDSDPKMSIKLIEALSVEFYSMMEMADKQLVPLKKEIELCRAHLEIMSIRNDVDYELNTGEISPDIEVPPAILHTLVENGITHNLPVNGKVIFDLEINSKENSWSIHVKTIGLTKNHGNPMAEGTGLKYVRSRLEESFPGRWELTNRKTDYGWETQIAIK